MMALSTSPFKTILKTFLALCLFLSSCSSPAKSGDGRKLTSLSIQNRNGVSESIASKERLKRYDRTDFLDPQPYEQVRAKFQEGKTENTELTSYHPNGQVWQFLQVRNQQAFGEYREWHPNGCRKVEAKVCGGQGALNAEAQDSWVFDGPVRSWNEEGILEAEFFHRNGLLEGLSTLYHPNGCLNQEIPYRNGKVHGFMKRYSPSSVLIECSAFHQNQLHGERERFYSSGNPSSQEKFEKGLLEFGKYFDKGGEVLSTVERGCGFQMVEAEDGTWEKREIRDGLVHGLIEEFDVQRRLHRTYYLNVQGKKSGPETLYFPQRNGEEPRPRVLVTWCDDLVQGEMKTWYPNGQLESQREFRENKKNGLATAWFANGNLMFVERYQDDRLVDGKYFAPTSQQPISCVVAGEGTASLFDENGFPKREVQYRSGKAVKQ